MALTAFIYIIDEKFMCKSNEKEMKYHLSNALLRSVSMISKRYYAKVSPYIYSLIIMLTMSIVLYLLWYIPVPGFNT